MKTRICSLFLLGLLAASTPAAHAQVFSVLYNFGTNPGDPTNPYTPCIVAQGRDGNLYSTTTYGGASNSGAVFKITPAGTLTVLYSFDVTHGEYASSGLTLGTDGNFYGTTVFGGTFTEGVVFKISPGGKLTVLYNFTGGSDGAFPYAPPVQGTDGNFYGTTSSAGDYGWGTVYRITPSGVLTSLYQFNSIDGRFAQGPLIQATDGDFYGTTREGSVGEFGEVFKITPAGELTVLYSFDYTHGAQPEGGLVQGRDSNFYGTTVYGGPNAQGIVYQLTPSGVFTILHSFSTPDGIYPFANLLQATDGNLYGATEAGGSMNSGTLYSISPHGSFSVLVNLDATHGATPYSTPLQHTSGMLFGDTESGGAFGYGTFYGLKVGLGPFVSLLPTSGRVGTSISILGQGFTGTTAVSFNGTPAIFSVKSDTYLTATVPTGATSGFVTVVTPGGALKSNRKFHVRP